MIRPATRFVVNAVAAVVAATAIITAAAAWRLASGPVSLNFLTPYVQDALRQSDSPYRVEFSETILTWAGWERTLDIRILDVRAVGPGGGLAATAPEISIALSVPALLRGIVAPTSLEVIEPKVRIVRGPDGRIELGLGEAQGLAGDPIELLLADLLAPPDPARAMGYLKRVSVVGADLTVVDRRLGVSWYAPSATVSLARDGTGIAATASLDLEVGGNIAVFDARARYNSADGAVTVNVSFDGVQPEWFAHDTPVLAPLAAARFPVGGSIDIVLGDGAQVSGVTFDLNAGAGILALGEWFDNGIEITFAQAKGHVDVALERVRLDDIFIDVGGPKLSAQGLFEGFGRAPFIAGDMTVTDLPIDEVERYWPRDFWPKFRNWIAANRSGGVIRTALTNVHIQPQGGGGPALPEEAVRTSIELDVGGRTAKIDARLRYGSADRGVAAHVEFTGLRPEWFAGTTPGLVALAGTRFPVNGNLDLVVDADGGVTQVGFDVSAGAGDLALGKWFDNAFPIVSAQAKGLLELGPEKLRLDEVYVDFGGPRLALQGWVEGFNETPFIAVGATVTDLAIDDMFLYWPRGRLPRTREWLAGNVNGGILRKAQANIHLRPEDQTGAGIPEEALRIGIEVEGTTVHYQRPLPPVVALNAVGTITGSTIDIALSSGRLKGLNIEEARLIVSDLSGAAQGSVDVKLIGPLRDAIEVLAHPYLGYAQQLGIDPTLVGGTARAQLRFDFPLAGDTVAVVAHANLRDVEMPGAFEGYDLSRGVLDLTFGPQGLDVSGTVRLNGVPATAAWHENFAPGAQYRSRFAVRGRFTDAQRELLGMPGNQFVTGPANVDIDIIDSDQGRRRWRATAELRDAAVRIPGIRWRKEPGVEGIVQIEGRNAPGQPIEISRFDISAGDLSASGRAELDPGGAGLRTLELDHLEFGNTSIEATMAQMPGSGYAINLTGARVDLRPFLDNGRLAAGDDDEELPPLTLTARLGQVIINDRTVLHEVNAVLDKRNGRWEAVTATARLANKSRLALHIAAGDAGRVLQMTADDAGELLRTFDFFDNMIGGTLLLTAALDVAGDPDAVIGELRIDDHRLVNAPMLAKILSVASLTGIFELLKGDGLPFRRLVAPFTMRNDVIEVSDARSYGSALGITMEGEIDLARDVVDIDGTLVPAYALNSALGFLPVIGDILVGPTGGGVFAATYRLSGSLDNPSISVNPLAALAPGILRKLFLFLGPRDKR